MTQATLGLIGARGHTGRELLALVGAHPRLELAYASSRALAGRPVAETAPEVATDVLFEALAAEEIRSRPVDVAVLALPNGKSDPYAEAARHANPDVVLVDLSADHRFDDAWTYGLVERNREALRGSRAIANPGCYATGIQLALGPLLPFVQGPLRAFGVSGYSGAGTTPSRKNDPEALLDNLMPYGLTDHTHEREVTRQLGYPIRFHPHVAPFFRGISLTLSGELAEPMLSDTLVRALTDAYDDEPLVEVVSGVPEVQQARGRHGALVGGVTVNATATAFAAVAVLDNLLKGAATQAMQNINLALGFDELTSIPL